MKKYLILMLAFLLVAPCEARKKKKNKTIETFEMPCSEFCSSDGVVRAWAVGRSDNESTARKKAQAQASADLAAQLQKTVSITTEAYTSALGAGSQAASKHFLNEQATILVKQVINGATIVCDKWTKDEATGQYSNYVTMELKGQNFLDQLFKVAQESATPSQPRPDLDKELLTKLFLQNIGVDQAQ